MRWPFARRTAALTSQQAARLAAWRAAPGPARGYLVLDLETSGLDLRRDRLISLGCVPVEHGRLLLGRALHRVLRQDAPSARANILIHGVGPTRQLQGMPPADALLDLLEAAAGRTLVAFHAPFDAGFLTRALRRHLAVRALPNTWLDLARLLPALFPGAVRGEASLDDWLAHFDIPHTQRHSAHADALATAQLFLVALKRGHHQGLSDADALCAQAQVCSRFPAGGGISGV